MVIDEILYMYPVIVIFFGTLFISECFYSTFSRDPCVSFSCWCWAVYKMIWLQVLSFRSYINLLKNILVWDTKKTMSSIALNESSRSRINVMHNRNLVFIFLFPDSMILPVLSSHDACDLTEYHDYQFANLDRMKDGEIWTGRYETIIASNSWYMY